MYNTVSLGICLEGAFDNEYIPKEQWEALLDLLVSLKKDFPRAEIKGHREMPNVLKTCPGMNVDLNKLREEFKTHYDTYSKAE